MKINAGNLKKGDFINYQNDIWQVQKAEFYSPGKGSALMKTKIWNVKSQKNIDVTFKSMEEIEVVDVESRLMVFLYKDNDNLYFMDEKTYNQYQVLLSSVSGLEKYLKEGDKVYVYLYDEKPLSVRPPLSVRLKVIEAEDVVKGDTVSGAKKPVKLETGAIIMVPLFIKIGDIVIVNPETGEYAGREGN